MKFITAEWRKLIMANYEIEPEILKGYIPAGTELDTYNDKHYISLVGFMFLHTKVLGIRVPFHSNFPEVNLRFYVRYGSNNNRKRGVVFINEFVPKHSITLVANNLYKEKYVTYPMQHKWDTANKLMIGYYWKKEGNWNKIEVTAAPNSFELVPASKEEFITEHYWGYSAINKNKTGEYQVEHPRWVLYPVEEYSIDCNFEKLYGENFKFLDQAQPASVFLAEGSPVTIYSKKIL